MSRRVLVTAGAAGIGRVIAEQFIQDGSRVAVCDADPAAVQSFADAHPGSIAVVADVTSESAMDAFLSSVEAEWGGIDVVCANAGTGGPAGPIEDLAYDAWQQCLATNVHGAYLTCRWAARVMKAQKSGLIVMTSSTAGIMGYPMRSPQVSMRLPLSATVHRDRYQENSLLAKVEAYDAARAAAQPYKSQRSPETFGTSQPYGWSDDKTRQYSVPERADFGAYLRARGFTLD